MREIPREHLNFWWSIAEARCPAPYGYGGAWSPTNLGQTTDCSGIASYALAAITMGPNDFKWARYPYSTESWRVVEVGAIGPFGTICVASPNDIPHNAVAKVGCSHGGGGPYSHMAVTVEGVNVESRGGSPPSGGQMIGGSARGYDDSLFHDWHYLPATVGGGIWTEIYEEIM